MMTPRLLSVLLPALLGLVTWSTLSAQSEWLPEDATPIQRQFIDEAGGEFSSYWNPKLNEYKRTIDRMLSPNDLQKLNGMRVRWGILMDKLTKQLIASKEMADEDEGKKIEFSISGEDEDGFMEVMEIWSGTMQLATGYRSGLDNLSGNVVEDVGDFTDQVANFVEEFSQLHRAELQGDEKGTELLANQDEVAESIRGVRQVISMENKGFAQVYSFAVEPLILLYNGGNLGDLLPFISNQTSGTDLDVVAGLLPKGGVLQQNYPNPASSKTTIPFTLNEPGKNATLRIYSADGGLVETIELGSLGSGEKSYELDVSDYTAGSYLYHLSITGGEGEMVYSRVMQVVR